MIRHLGLISVLAALVVGLTSPVYAHPHVWVTAKAEVVFGPDAKIAGVRHQWTFDEAYTAYMAQGLDKNNDGDLTAEELQDLANENAAGLRDFNYFTTLKINGKPQPFDEPREAKMVLDEKRPHLVMTFFLPLKIPVPARGAAAVEIEDPTFFVYFSLSEGQAAISLANAPKGCVTSIAKAKPLDASMQQILQDEGAIQTQNIGVEYSNRAIIACP